MTEEKVIINIETKQSQENVGNLRKEIKTLKEQLYQLEEGTDEYNRVQKELGERLFKVKDEQEKANLQAKDWGVQLSNATRVMNGAIGGVTALTSTLSLMGVEIGEDEKLTQSLIKAMAILQGISAVEGAIDSFRALASAIKTSTIATKGLATAMNFLKSHPIIAVLSVVTAVGGAVWGIVEGMKSSNDEAKKLTKTLQETQFEELTNKLNGDSFETKKLQTSGASEQEVLNQKQKEFNEIQKEANKLIELQRTLIKYSKDEDKAKMQGQIDSMEKLLKKKEEELTQEQELIKIKDEKAKKEEALAKSEEARQKRQQEHEEYLNSLPSEEYKQKYELQKGYNQGLISELDYKRQILAIDSENIRIEKQNTENAGKELSQEWYDKELDRIKLMKEVDELIKQQAVDEKEANNEKENTLKNLDIEIQYLQKKKDVQAKSQLTDEEKQGLSKRDINKLEIAKQTVVNEELLQIEKEYEDAKYQMQVDAWNREEELLNLKLKNQIISMEEFNNSINELNIQRTQQEQEQINKRIEQDKLEAEAKKKIEDLIKQQQLELTSAIGGLLGGIADNLSEETEAYKHLKAAEAIINTLSASVSVFTQMSAETGGWGIALAIAEASGIIASGMATVRQIYAVDTSGGKNNTNYNLTSGANASINKNYSNARLTDSNGVEVDIPAEISKSMSNIRVWVSASDITNTQNDMKRVEVNNSF